MHAQDYNDMTLIFCKKIRLIGITSTFLIILLITLGCQLRKNNKYTRKNTPSSTLIMQPIENKSVLPIEQQSSVGFYFLTVFLTAIPFIFLIYYSVKKIIIYHSALKRTLKVINDANVVYSERAKVSTILNNYLHELAKPAKNIPDPVDELIKTISYDLTSSLPSSSNQDIE